ncbi:hypothetical protein FTX61_13780 [Nitriliruptoraceae bacterium ZYF776]|nr:hypothetical protein [Profundirhabdus halotolerans]
MRRTLAAVAAAALVVVGAVPASGQTSGFTDVPRGNVHADAISRGVAQGLILGTSATTFEPGRAVTRAQAASLVQRTLRLQGVELPPASEGPRFTDTGAPHEDAIRQLAAAGIVQGKGDGRFDPQGLLTRDQFATFVTQASGYVLEELLTGEREVEYEDVPADNVHADNIAIATELGLVRGLGDGRFDPRGTTRRDQAASIVVRFDDLLTERRQPPPEPVAENGEVWVLDQGTDTIHVYDGDAASGERGDFTEVTSIDVRPGALEAQGFTRPNGQSTVPHMIEFDSEGRYAFIASTAGGVTIVVDARHKQVVDVLATGPGSHMAAVTPDDDAVWVAVIGTSTNPRVDDGTQRMVEITFDLDADEPEFELGRSLAMSELLEPLEDANGWTYPSYSPICHQYDPDGEEAWITLGPSWNQGGLVVLDLASGTLVEEAAYDPAEIKANCGVSVTEDRVVVNWSGRVQAGEDTPGEWYVFDPDTYEQIGETKTANGFDTHGLRLSPDGSTYWQVNRISDEALLIDAETLEPVREIEDVAVTPDILAFSPDGALVYITQRGPNPRSGAIHAATGDEPGLRVVDTATGETVTVLEQPEILSGEGAVLNDVHGVGVRIPSDEDTIPSPPVLDSRVATRSAASSTVAFDAPRPEPTNLGAHCGIPAA